MLEKINTLKIVELSAEQQEKLCEELRRKIIETVSLCGGHLSSNLGVVELTVAMFSVFDFPTDKVIFDVGHQCYPYKLLTGRYEKFDTLRKRGGISGFPKRAESEYDCYDTGHAGNSVSAAIGLATAYKLKKESRTVIAVIGDGSFNNGLIYEALNSLSVMGVNVLIILNDNDMSISPTVGRTHELMAEKNEERKFQNIQLIQQYGVKYIEEKNGNNTACLIEKLKQAKELLKDSPVILHIHTVKGMGYEFCEEYPMETHGVSPVGSQQGLEYSHKLGKKLQEIAKKDDRVVAVTAAMTDALGLREFFNAYPDRSFDVSICEENASVLCAGLACGGMKPYYAIYSTFLQRAFDEVMIDICAQDLPVTFCIDRGGLSGSDGETHQGVFDLSYLSLIPNLTIAVPKDGKELEEMLELSLTYDHPLAIRYPRSTNSDLGSAFPIEVGSFEYLTEKTDAKLTVLACGERAIDKAFLLRRDMGINFDIVNARFVKPLDEELLKGILSGNIMTIEDNVKIGGFGEKIRDFYDHTDKKVKIFGYEDKFIPHGGVKELQEEYGWNSEQMKGYIRQIYEDR